MSETTLTGTAISETHTIQLPIPAIPTDGEATPRTREIVAEADLLKEYVASIGGFYTPWLGSTGLGGAYLRQLPNPIDDLMLSFGTRLYDDDMMRDPQVNSVVSVLVMALMCQGVTYSNPIKQGEDGFDIAEKVLAFCKYCIDNLKSPMPSIRYELAEGMLKMGHKIAELMWEPRSSVIPGDNKERVVLYDIKPRSHDSTAFVTDGFSNTLGITYIRQGESLPTLGNYILENIEKLRLVSLEGKFTHPTHKSKNCDPRGTSHLKAIYVDWWQKQQTRPQHMAYLARFAQPSLVANLDKEAKDIPVYNTDNQIVSHKSIIGATTQALAKVKGGAVASFIATDVQMLESKGDGKVIFDSYDHSDRQIAKGILWQTMTTEESAHMARAAGATHQDVFGIGIQFLRDILEWSERREILFYLTFINFGEEAAHRFTPLVSYGEVAAQDIPKMMAALAQLSLAGGIHRSEWPAIRAMLGLPPADPDQEAADYEDIQKAKAAQADLAKQKMIASIKDPSSVTGPSKGDNNPNPQDNPRKPAGPTQPNSNRKVG